MNPIELERIRQRFRSLRLALDLNQGEVGEWMDCSQANVSYFERGGKPSVIEDDALKTAVVRMEKMAKKKHIGVAVAEAPPEYLTTSKTFDQLREEIADDAARLAVDARDSSISHEDFKKIIMQRLAKDFRIGEAILGLGQNE